jgi:hypothetical protein
MRLLLASLLTAAAISSQAMAQPAPSQSDAAAVNGADQVVGLFGAACLQFAGDAGATRQFLNVKLALVSLDDGACEAVVEQANPAEVLSTLQQAATENHVPLTALGTQADKKRQGVQHAAYSLTIGAKTMHVLVSTAAAPPQAVLTLVPR